MFSARPQWRTSAVVRNQIARWGSYETLAVRAIASHSSSVTFPRNKKAFKTSQESTNPSDRFLQDAAQRLADAAVNVACIADNQVPVDLMAVRAPSVAGVLLEQNSQNIRKGLEVARGEFVQELNRTRKLANVFNRSERHILNSIKAVSASGFSSSVRLFSSSSNLNHGIPLAKVVSENNNSTRNESSDNISQSQSETAMDDENWAGLDQPVTWGQLVRPTNIPLFVWALDETIGIAIRSRYYAAKIKAERYFNKDGKKEDDAEMSEAEKKLKEEAKKMKRVWGEIRKGLKTGQSGPSSGGPTRSSIDPERKERKSKSNDSRDQGKESDDDDPPMPKNIVGVILGFALMFWLISTTISAVYEERLGIVTRKELKELLLSGRVNSVHIRGTSAEMRLSKPTMNDYFSSGSDDPSKPYSNLKPVPQPTSAEVAAQAANLQAAREAVAATGSPSEEPAPASGTASAAFASADLANTKAKEAERAELKRELVNKYLSGERVFFGVPSGDGAQRMIRSMCQEIGIEDPPMIFEEPSVIGPFLLQVAVFGLIFFGASRFFSGLKPGSGPFSSMKRNFKAAQRPNVTFKDVAGLDQAKVEIMEFVDFLANPHKYKALGARLPKGALLVGPPGTGKTLLAKATAGEAKVPFFSVSGSDFQEMFVGVGSARVRELFKEARKSAPSIIFIDEVDAIGRARARGGTPSHEERENTLNAMLVEMDGFSPSENVVVLAGTNRAELLDKALTRPGRFDRQISIDAPDIKGRVEIFKVHLKPLKLGLDADEVATKMAALTPGMVGADIANVCNEAALVAARHNKQSVELVDFEKAVDRIIGGLEKNSNILTPEERKLVAYHEAGHAICGWFLENADPLLKVTIIPRAGGALGFAQYLPKEVSLYRVRQFQDRIAMALGGRAAEQVCFSEISSGASDDIKRTMRMAQVMVARLGMSKELANLCLEGEEGNNFTKPFSENTAEIVDAEVKKIIDEQYDRAIKLLTEKKDLLEKLGSALLEKETLNHDELVAILGPRPFQSDAYLKYLEIQQEEKLKRDEAKKAEQEEKDKESEKQKENEKEKEKESENEKEKEKESENDKEEKKTDSKESEKEDQGDKGESDPKK